MTVPAYWQPEFAGAQLTSIKIGGPIKYFTKITDGAQVEESLAAAQEMNLPVRLVAGGSNLILPDKGFHGLIMQIRLNEKEILSEEATTQYAEAIKEWELQKPVQERYAPEESGEFLQLAPSAVTESQGELRLVRLGGGVPWGQAVIWTLDQGAAGLQWYARIPCHIAGAVVNNIHGEKHFLSEVVVAVHVWDKVLGKERVLTHKDLEFGYDTSLLHKNHDFIVLAVIFGLRAEDPARVASYRKHYIDWTKEKNRVQPHEPNSGSVFQNFDHSQVGDGAAVSAAWYIDKSGMKGKEWGDLQIYSGHANFIINHGGGTQQDFIELVKEIRATVFERFHLWLKPEVECMDTTGQRLIWEEKLEPRWNHV